MNKKRLLARRAAIAKRLGEINSAAETAERLELTAEEQTEFDALSAELQQVEAALAREERLAEIERTAPAAYTPEGQGGRIETHGPAWRNDPNRGFADSREFFRGVMQATIDGRTSDERLLFLSAKRVGYQATAGSDEHGTYSDPYGGFFVPSGFVPTLLQVPTEGDPTAGRTMFMPMESPSVSIPARTDKDHSTSVSGGLIVYRRSETQSVTATRMQVEQVTLSAEDLMGISYATEKLIRYSAISFAALLQTAFRTEFSAKILYEKLHGTGAGQMEGVINSPAAVSVSKEAGQAADTIVYNNIVKMRARCWGYGNAIWLYNQDCLPTLSTMFMPVGTGGTPMWVASAREGEPDMLWGRPAYATEFCASIGDVGDIILCNWSQYLEGLLQPPEMAESVHVRFLQAEDTFRVKMSNDGRCWWRTPLTTKKSAVTLSPIVLMAAR